MAVRKIQNTILRVGPFKFPVALLTATDAKGGLKFQNVHTDDGGSIKSNKTCNTCKKTVGSADIVKQYTFDDGFSIEVTSDDFSDAFGNPSKNMSIKKFVPIGNINPILLEKSYYIVPNNLKDEGFSSFVDALYRSNSAGVVSLFFHGSEHLGVVRAATAKTLVVQQIEYPENLRIPKEISLTAPADSEVVNLMENFIETLTDYNSSLNEFQDTFSVKMKKVLENKRRALTKPACTVQPQKIDEDDTATSVEEIKQLLATAK